MKRLKDKVAIVVGAGQSPGAGLGIGRATTLKFGQEGALVLAIDRELRSVEETAAKVAEEGGTCIAFQADVTEEAALAKAVATARERWGRIDILNYNVGVSLAAGDAVLKDLTEAAFDRVNAINLRGAIMMAKHVLPIMREQRSGVIINVSSIAAIDNTYNLVAYKTSKAGLSAFTQQIAMQNAEYGVRANTILPGVMETPMAMGPRLKDGKTTFEQLSAERDAKVPLRRKMGSPWDVANAAVFLASDEANFITGVALPVDGGALARIG
jgi:NAD(P)-dependent dehydrogenase (short-subunit alcohol dehydrogenase family)